MSSSQVRFCDFCGAGNTLYAINCFACNSSLAPLSSPTIPQDSIAPVSTPSGGGQMQVQVQTTIMEAPLLRGDFVAARYRIVREIGRGGFGTVYLARDFKHDKLPVAIKRITLSRLSARDMIDATDSYNREVAVLTGMEHQHLSEIYDHFTDTHYWYLVMKYIKGKTLEEILRTRKGRPLDVYEVLKIGIQLCEVLEYLHSYDPPIIFRDIKPGNIMLTRKGDICLIDFGTARRYVAGRKRDTGSLGTPGYAAPEQYGLAQSSPQTDVFGMGVTLQTLLTGKEPLEFLQTEGVDLFTRYQIPPPLQLLLEQMQESNPEERPDIATIRKSLKELVKNAHKFLPQQQKIQFWLAGFLGSTSLIGIILLLNYYTNIPYMAQWGVPILAILGNILAIIPGISGPKRRYITWGWYLPTFIYILIIISITIYASLIGLAGSLPIQLQMWEDLSIQGGFIPDRVN